jgi:hypothetical protein
VRAALKELARAGEDAAIAAIDQSIAKGWQGLFPERAVARGQEAGSVPYSAKGAGQRLVESLRGARVTWTDNPRFAE